jgi:hypothetical protein
VKLVVAHQRGTQPRGLDTYDGINHWIETGRAPEDVDRYRICLDCLGAAGEKLLGNEAQESLVALGAMEFSVAKQPVQLRPGFELGYPALVDG